MARRRLHLSTFAQMQREAARAQAAQVRAQAAARREAERARTAYLRAAAADERERKRLYAESRAAEVAAKNDDLEAEMAALHNLLTAALKISNQISFSSLKGCAVVPPWRHAELEKAVPPPPRKGSTSAAQFESALQWHAERERVRIAALGRARAEWRAAADAANAEAQRQHAEIDAFEADYRRGEQDAVAAYCSMVLEASQYPTGFLQQFKLAYVPESRQVIVEYELPAKAVIPAVRAYKYVKNSNSITKAPLQQTQINALYASVVAQVAIRTIHELFEADAGGHIDTVVFNGVVETTDPGNGRRVRPCLVTLRTTRDVFRELNLAHVEPPACLRHLGAGVSKNPSELTPVRPVLEFSRVDPRFVAESDGLSALDQRPNLMELSPTEFETLIQNLFTKIGLEARQTRPSRDGGVDCVAWDPRPIFGGKVVIQAKRYKNTVGVSAVRDLFGTLQHEGASKGILVTTAGYGQASFDFAQNKPIELIDGANLLYLLSEHAGIEAKIMPPDDWKDPTADPPHSEGTRSSLLRSSMTYGLPAASFRLTGIVDRISKALLILLNHQNPVGRIDTFSHKGVPTCQELIEIDDAPTGDLQFVNASVTIAAVHEYVDGNSPAPDLSLRIYPSRRKGGPCGRGRGYPGFRCRVDHQEGTGRGMTFGTLGHDG
jgi:restriction system protein